VTTWSVVNDDTTESGPRRRYFRYAVFALAALLVLSLGFVLIPREPDAPAAPPFSEQARAAAFSDAVDLRALALASGEATEAARQVPTAAASQRAVTLLTVQARALMLPADKLPTDRSMAISSAPPSSAQEPPSSAAELATALHASGAQRLRDAEKADGGIARLLAGTGTAQLLAAEEMAAATGTALDALPGRTVPGPVPASPAPASPAASSAAASSPAASSAGAPAAGCTATATSGGADLASSFTSVARAELELVYAYQAALTRLPPASVAPASDFLTQHEDASREAEAAAGARCAALPPTPAGYALDAAFLADPAAALGVLEAGTLPAYGDLVALTEGTERAWALSALQSAARRTAHWGASPGPVPGMVLDASALPALPDPPQAPGIPATSSVP
jgi:hypothetical protein